MSKKNVPKEHEIFSVNEINFICNYFESNNIKELNREIKIDILNLLGKEDNYNNRKALSVIFRKKGHTNISSNYNF